MSAAQSLQAGLRELATRPADVAPHYFLAVGVGFAARTPLFVGLGVAVALLRAQGRIEPVVEALDGFDIDGGAGGLGGMPQLPPGLEDALAGLVTPVSVSVLVLAALLSLVLFVLARGVAAAGTLTAQAEALGVRHARTPGSERTPLVAGIGGISGDWRAFTLLALLRGVVVLALAVGVVVGLVFTLTGVGALVGLPLVLLAGTLGPLVALVLSFAGQAIAVDGEGARSGIVAAASFLRHEPLSFGLYAVVALVVLLGSASVGAGLGVLGVGRLGAILGGLLVTPALDAVRTGIYAGDAVGGATDSSDTTAGETTTVGGASDTAATDTDTDTADAWAGTGFEQARPVDGTAEPETDMSSPTSEPEPVEGASAAGRNLRESAAALGGWAWGGLGDGLRALGRFVADRPLLNLGGTATLLVGVWLGWRLTAPYGAQIDPPADVAGVFGEVALSPFVNIAANNWLVALSQGFGGVAFGIPSVVNLLFNGVLVGALAGVYDPPTFAALVVPHALVEVPALGAAGALGVHLGSVGYRALRGRLAHEEIAAELRRATRITVGLLPVFVLAALIEAFLTPRIAAFVLGG